MHVHAYAPPDVLKIKGSMREGDKKVVRRVKDDVPVSMNT
jgi:hypothetical protein